MINITKRPQIFICTEDYPYGNSEDTFIEPELEELLQHYDVTFISHMHSDNCEKVQRDGFEGIKSVNINVKLKWYDRIIYFLKFLLDEDGRKEIGLILREKKEVLHRIYLSAGFFALAMQNYKMMEYRKLFPKNDEFIYYTYWYFYYTYSMTKYRNRFPNMKIVTRTHGFDLYDERYNGQRQPFKEIMNPRIDKIAFISKYGKEYYLKKYRFVDSIKYGIYRLGTKGTASSFDNLKKDCSAKFRMVSCSSLVSLKRVDLIIRALSLLDEEIEWVHFGDGSELENLTNLACEILEGKKNISYNIRGFISNEDVMKFYLCSYINCFISTSSSEGIPVSIQEAMSFGIPVIATDVGGVSELFDKNGILLGANPTPNVVAEAIRKMIYLDKETYQNWRLNSYRIWNEKYNAKTNSKSFVEMLRNI